MLAKVGLGFVGWADFLPTLFNQSSAWANKNILPTLLGSLNLLACYIDCRLFSNLLPKNHMRAAGAIQNKMIKNKLVMESVF
jgi:hypothetical protein